VVRQTTADILQVIQHRVTEWQQTGNRLGRIEYTATTDADYGRDAIIEMRCNQFIHPLWRRLTTDRFMDNRYPRLT